MLVASFVFFLLVFIVIGIASASKASNTSEDYLLANQEVKPWLVALSAVATNNSGYMFIGLIGFAYAYGLHAMWLMIGWIVGDFLISFLVHKKLRIHTENHKALSFTGVISKWFGTDYKYLRMLGGLVTLMFLGAYAAAQLNAGSKALHVLFGWDYAMGAIIGSVIVLLYCLAGGIRASIWTDAAQSFVMLAAMLLMMVVSVYEVGGVASFIDQLHHVAPHYMDLFPPNHPLGAPMGPILFVAGWFFAGIGIIGQPHAMVRFMTMEDANQMGRVRLYYYSWYSAFSVLAIATALAARLLVPDTHSFDVELALPMLAGELLPPVLVGLVLAGLFAATMSTADSQILSCTAAITHDFPIKKWGGYLAHKFATVFVTVVALSIALVGSDSVFSLVVVAWSALASAFAPLLIVYALGRPVSEKLAIIMLLGGMGAMAAWRLLGLNDITYEVFPGIMAGLLIFIIGDQVKRLQPA